MNFIFLKRATYSAFLTSVTFWLLFQLSKIRVIQNAAPFAEDPYDAIASFAFQIAMVIALLSLARLVSIQDEEGRRQRAPFILRGVLLVEFCVLVTLIANTIALFTAMPLVMSDSMVYILVGMILLAILFTVTAVFWGRANRELGKMPVQARQDALGQTIQDCWTLFAVIANHVLKYIPFLKPLWERVDSWAHKIANSWIRKLPFADPNRHPWRFAMTFAVLSGLLFMSIVLVMETILEGGPASLMIALLLAGIFFAGETLAVILSFTFFGGYLGLRPKIR